jgi:hypothetical protein
MREKHVQKGIVELAKKFLSLDHVLDGMELHEMHVLVNLQRA